jgi:two-component system, NtrC family, response regulator AtoC
MTFSGASLLLLEDEALLRKRLASQLGKLGLDVTAVVSVAEARRSLRDLSFDFALFDINLPDGRSLDLLAEKAVPANTVVLLMTAEGGVAGAVEAMRLGAADYLVKPFELDDLTHRLARARRERQAARGDQFRRAREAAGGDRFFFGEALAPVRAMLDKILAADQRLASTGAVPPPVLIEGETGTGKTTLARWLHERGPRSAGPFIDVNCSALPDSLAESELFGHERGAFTDAKEARLGLIEAAEGGTLFLDELPSLSPAIQAKMLKVIEDRAVRRVGGNRTVTVDVRLIAASNTDLRALVAAGRFREDLLHRLDLFRLRIPPLRERGGDIVALAQVLAEEVARRYGLPPPTLPSAARERLLRHRWPGNVRELAHEIERSLVFDDDRLAFSSLARPAGSADAAHPWLNPDYRFEEGSFSLEAAIDALVQRALAQSDGNVSAAARLLGVPRDTVRYRLRTTARAEDDPRSTDGRAPSSVP